MQPARKWEVIFVNTYWVGLSFMWNSLHLLLLPAVLLTFVSDERKNTALGLLTFVGLILALVIQPISGALSDRWTSRFGRRRPLLVMGTLLDVVFLAVLATAGGIPALAVGYIGLQLTSNVAHGPAQGLMYDRVAPEQMGRASGIKNFFDMAGMVVSSLLVGRMLSAEDPDLFAPVALVIAILLVGLGFTVFGVRETSTSRSLPDAVARPTVRQALRLDWRAHPAFFRLVLVRLLFLVGVYGIQAFAQYYVRDVLQPENPVKLTGDLLATIVLTLIAFSILSGFLCDRVGRKPLHVAAAVLVAIGSVLMLAARTPTAVLVYGSIVGAGIGIFLTANWALANDLSPSGEAGKFLGLTNLATAGAGALSRLSGPGIDALNALRPGSGMGYTALFTSAAVLALGSLILLKAIPDQAWRRAPAPDRGL
jgi:MFS family permease